MDPIEIRPKRGRLFGLCLFWAGNLAFTAFLLAAPWHQTEWPVILTCVVGGLLLLPLAGCTSTSETRNMPVNILTAAPANAQATDMPRVEQTLRPKDVLDVIFHISTSGSDAYRVQSVDQIGLNFTDASLL